MGMLSEIEAAMEEAANIGQSFNTVVMSKRDLLLLQKELQAWTGGIDGGKTVTYLNTDFGQLTILTADIPDGRPILAR